MEVMDTEELISRGSLNDFKDLELILNKICEYLEIATFKEYNILIGMPVNANKKYQFKIA